MHQPLINITRKQAFLFALFFVLYEFLTYIANDMIMPGMIKVIETFHADESAIASSLTAYLLGGASLQLILGPLSDRYGRRPVMITGAWFFFLSTALIACSSSIHQFLVIRFFEGMGLCFIYVIGYATIQEIFEEMDAVRLIAAMANVSIVAPLLGPLLGAWFVYYFNWRIIFILIASLSLVTLWGMWRYMPEPIGQTTRLGHHIKPTPFSFSVVFSNYKQLFLNKPFILGSIAGGFLGVPCLSWIGLAPVIIITKGHQSMIEYGVWQIPIFGAFITGNLVLQYLTRHMSVIKMVWIGTIFAGVSLCATYILPLMMGNDFIWLTPGLIIYFFGFGIASGPLNRYILFSTPVSKGTAAALMSMITMCVLALGVEIANELYKSYDNIFLGGYCALSGVLYVSLLLVVLHLNENQSD